MALAAEMSTFEAHEPASTQSFNRPVDLVHLSRYTLGNRSLEREVLSLFLTQSAIYLQRLKEAGADKDWVDAAHTIKGSAKSIGAWQLARSAETAEAMNGGARKSGSPQLLADLERLIGETNSYIESLLAEVSVDA